jgi:nickel-dependent lactate racemase
MSNKSPQERMAFLTQLQKNMHKMAVKDSKDVNIRWKRKNNVGNYRSPIHGRIQDTGKSALKYKYVKKKKINDYFLFENLLS